MSLLTLLQLVLGKARAAAVTDSSTSTQGVVAAGIFLDSSANASASSDTTAATGVFATSAAAGSTSTNSVVANVTQGVSSASTSISSDQGVAQGLFRAGATATSVSTDSATASHDRFGAVSDTSLSSELVAFTKVIPIPWGGTGHRPRITAGTADDASGSHEVVRAKVIQMAAIRDRSVSAGLAVGETSDYWMTNQAVLAAELDQDLLAVAS